MPDVLTYVLHYEGAFNKNSLGAVSEGAARAAEIGGECHAVVVGGDDLTDELCQSLGAYGATKVFRAKGPEGLAQPVVDVMAKVIDEQRPRLRAVRRRPARVRDRRRPRRAQARRRDDGGHQRSRRGRQARRRAPDPAGLADLGVALQGRPRDHHRPDQRVRDRRSATAARREVVDVDVEYSPWSNQATMVQRGEQRGADVDIEGADILVAGGRGLGKAEGFELAEELAGAFGGNSAVAATRAVVDAGWYPYAAQIGQTGKTVSPKLYLAAGISGAIQHKVGMQSSENIVAINKDANAPIFEFSDLGIVGDLNKILPKLTDAIKAKKG